MVISAEDGSQVWCGSEQKHLSYSQVDAYTIPYSNPKLAPIEPKRLRDLNFHMDNCDIKRISVNPMSYWTN